MPFLPRLVATVANLKDGQSRRVAHCGCCVTFSAYIAKAMCVSDDVCMVVLSCHMVATA